MKKLMLCRGVGTTALKGGVIPNLLLFSLWTVCSLGARHLATTSVADLPRFSVADNLSRGSCKSSR